MNRRKQFIANGLLVTAVSLLIRSVAVSFNVYISNKIGAVAMGLFTLITTVYSFSVTLATSGISFASTKLIADALGENHVEEKSPARNPTVACIVRKCILYALCFSIGTGILLFFLAPNIGKTILQDTRTILPLQVLAFTLPPIALSSVLSGYFTAVRHVYKNAVVQITGQVARIYGCILFISLLGADDVQSACLSIVLGGALSEGIAFLMQYLLYLLEKKKASPNSDSQKNKAIQSKLIHTALPIAFSAYVRSGLITLEHMLIPWGLQRSGASKDTSLAAYGTVHSMVFPLVLFPSALSGSFAGLLIPEVAQSLSQGDTARIDRIINKVFHAVLIFAVGTAGIMMCFSYELADVVYPSANAGKYILMIAPLIPVMYLDTSVDSILKGLGDQVFCMGVNIVDALLSVILVWTLLPSCGITGYIITVYFTETVNATLSITRLLIITKVKPRLIHWLGKPLLCIVLSTTGIRLILTHFDNAASNAWTLTAHISLAICMYMILLVATKTILLPRK